MNELRKHPSIKPLLMILTGVAYMLCPLDAIPDVIPFIGNLDDLGVIGLLIQRYVAYRLETEGQIAKSTIIDAPVKVLK